MTKTFTKNNETFSIIVIENEEGLRANQDVINLLDKLAIEAFQDHNKKLEDEGGKIINMPEKKNLWKPSDEWISNAFKEGENRKIFAIKNSKIGKNFLSDCINSFNNKCSKPNGSLKGSWASVCYEQGIMNILIAEKYSKYTTILTNEFIFNYNKCNNNVFIMHLYASSDKYRQKCFNSKKI